MCVYTCVWAARCITDIIIHFCRTPFYKIKARKWSWMTPIFKKKKREKERKATFAQMTKTSFMKRTYGCSLLKGNMPVIGSFKCVYRHIHVSVHATEHQEDRRLWTRPFRNENVNRGWLKPGWARNRLTVRGRNGFNQRLVQSAAKFTVWVPPWASWETPIDFSVRSQFALAPLASVAVSK